MLWQGEKNASGLKGLKTTKHGRNVASILQRNSEKKQARQMKKSESSKRKKRNRSAKGGAYKKRFSNGKRFLLNQHCSDNGYQKILV